MHSLVCISQQPFKNTAPNVVIQVNSLNKPITLLKN